MSREGVPGSQEKKKPRYRAGLSGFRRLRKVCAGRAESFRGICPYGSGASIVIVRVIPSSVMGHERASAWLGSTVIMGQSAGASMRGDQLEED